MDGNSDLGTDLRLVLFQRVKTRANMNVGTAHSEVNPNTRVMNSRGIWLSYVLGIGLLHVVLLSIPFFSVPVVWTLTNIIHNMVSRPRVKEAKYFGATATEFVSFMSTSLPGSVPAVSKSLGLLMLSLVIQKYINTPINPELQLLGAECSTAACISPSSSPCFPLPAQTLVLGTERS